jgi:hypothetical protein
MSRPKGSKNKLKGKAVEAKPKAKAKAKAKPPQKADPPDWLRKAMTIPPRGKGRPPGTKNNRPKTEPPQQTKRGKKLMAVNKPIYDPMDDPDLRAPDAANPTLDQSLPPPKSSKGTPLVLETVPEPAPLYDEVAAGEAIPYDNAEMLIAGTLGGGGDHHADAKRILGRMVEANWLLTKGTEGSAAGMAIKARKEAEAKRAKEAEAKARKEGDDPGRDEWDHRDAKAKDAKAKDAKGGKGTKEGEDARF